MKKTIAIIGTGIMGTGMGKVLLQKGYKVSCYNRTESNASDLIQAGATFAATPAEAAKGADVIIMMVWSREALEAVLTSENGGLFLQAVKGQVYIDMSTQIPETGIWEFSMFMKQGADFLDAPVHGTKGEANNGGLWIMVGGDKTVYDRTKSIFDCIGETHHYMGEAGKGFAAKLCGNHLVSTIVAALCESMVLAAKAGLDPKEVLKVWMESDFRSPVVEGVGNSIISRDFDVSFHLRTMVKDTELIRNFSESIQVPVMLSNVVHEINKIGQNMGLGEENASAVVKVFEQMANFTISSK